MTHEESQALWLLEKSSFEHEFKESTTSYGMAHLYDVVDELITSGKLLYSEFCTDLSGEFAKANNDGEPAEILNTIVTNLIDKYERISKV